MIPVLDSDQTTVTEPVDLHTILQSNHIDFTTFSAKIDVEAQDDKGKKPGITATFRMIKDSAIWVSLAATFLSIEVYRIYISRDSIVLLNKQDKTADIRPISYLQEISNIPLSLSDLQNLIIGNPIFLDTNSASLLMKGDSLVVKSAGQQVMNLITYEVRNSLLLRSIIHDLDAGANRSAQLDYSDYRPYSDFYFSEKRKILAVDEKTLDIQLDFKQYEFNKPLSVAFSIPKNYKKK